MNTSKPTNKSNTNPAVADRVFTFLRVFATVPEITSTMAKYAGFKAKDYEEGWQLLCNVSRYTEGGKSSTSDIDGALRELDEWDDVSFRRARAALHRLHPAQEAFVFQNLEAMHGPQAVVGVRIFLDRLDELESSTERAATKDADHAALATLAERGFDAAERARVRKLVDLAMSAPDLEALLASGGVPTQDNLDKLAAWYEDWAETARATIDRKDLLVRLGVSKRRRVGRGASASNSEVPATPVASPIATPIAPIASAPVAISAPSAVNGMSNGASNASPVAVTPIA